MEEKGLVMFVDDSEEDLFLLREAMKFASVGNEVVQMRNGLEALEYLQRETEARQRPCFIITDLKMPLMDGFEFLKWLHEHDEFRAIPVVVLSSSGEERDRRHAAELGCCDYYVKPSGFSQLARLMQHLDDTWIKDHCNRPVP